MLFRVFNQRGGKNTSNSSLNWQISEDMMSKDTDESWDFCPEALKNESFLSWFTRLAKENCSDARLLYQQLVKRSTLHKINLKKLGEELNMLILSNKKQNELALALHPYLNTPIQEFQMPPYMMKNTGNLLEYLSIPLKYPRFCPSCLAEDKHPYFRDWWFFKPYVVCPIHRCILLDSCPHCNSPIKFWNTEWNQSIISCPNCGKKISEDVIGIFELKDINYYEILNGAFDEFSRVVKNADKQLFFHRIWELFLSKNNDPWVKKIKSNKISLSSGRLLRIILVNAKEVAKHPTKTTPIEILDNIRTNRFTLHDLNRNNGKLPKELDCEIVNKRLNAIAPLLKIHRRTYDDVKKQSKNTGFSSKTLYNWMRRYREEGIAGLIPKHHKSGRRRKPIPSDFEGLVQHAVEEYVIGGEITTIKVLHEKLQIKAQNRGISKEVFTYQQLCKRIRQERKNRELQF